MTGPSWRDEQLAYYRAVADEYEYHSIDAPGQDELVAVVDSFRSLAMSSSSPAGRGCGPRDLNDSPQA